MKFCVMCKLFMRSSVVLIDPRTNEKICTRCADKYDAREFLVGARILYS